MAGNQADIAIIGGRKYWAGGPYSGMPVDSTPADAGDLTRHLQNPGLADPTGRVSTPTATAMPVVQGGEAGAQMPTVAGGFASNASSGAARTVGGPQPASRYAMPSWAQQPVSQPQVPAWAGQQPTDAPPRNPWQDVLAGARGVANFNPGGAFGVGKETLPSMQRWNRLAPSEQQGAAGYWQDHVGVSADDVYGLMNKLKPAGAFSSAPRWAGGGF
jgi:hypothetical protein